MNPTNLMSYIGSPEPQYGARKYTGSVASGYDAKRVESPKWAAEQAIIEGIIDALPNGSQILDVPVGTGRFIPAYARNAHNFIGVDVSEDMLAEAGQKIDGKLYGKTVSPVAHLVVGDVTKLDEILKEGLIDLAIMCRLTRWLNPEQRTTALKQLQRVSRKYVVFTARIANHPYEYPLADIEAAIEPGWHIADNIVCGEDDYRVFVLERA